MIELEVGKKRKILDQIDTEVSEGHRKVTFSSGGSSVFFKLRLSKLGGYSYGEIRVVHEGREYRRRIGRIELESIRRTLSEGEEHPILVGEVLVRLKPEALGYLFPRESYGRMLKFLLGLWKMGKEIRKLGGDR